MKIIYLILVAITLGCNSATEEKPQERVIVGTDIDVNKSTGITTVVTHYSDSTITVVNLNKAGELMDSTTIYPSKK